MKTIGVLGGLGPQATMDFEARVHHVSQQLLPQSSNAGYPPMVVYYFRQSPVIMPADGSIPISLPPVNPLLLDAARRLGGWADFLVITTNGLHHWQEEIEQASGRPVVSMIDAVMAEVQRRHWQRVGIVDFRPVEYGVYNAHLARLGIAWEVVPDAMLPGLTHAVHTVNEGRNGAAENELVREAIAYLRTKGVAGIIPACTEIPLMLLDGREDPDIINPAQLLAEAAVRYAKM